MANTSREATSPARLAVLDIPHTLSDMRFATHTPTAKNHARRAVADAMLAVHLNICCGTNGCIHPLD